MSDTWLLKTLVLGGVRSGKSGNAETLARVHGGPVTVIATATPMTTRCGRGLRTRARRPADWTVVEEPIASPMHFAQGEPGRHPVIECLTLWLTNLFPHAAPTSNRSGTRSSTACHASRRSSSRQ